MIRGNDTRIIFLLYKMCTSVHGYPHTVYIHIYVRIKFNFFSSLKELLSIYKKCMYQVCLLELIYIGIMELKNWSLLLWNVEPIRTFSFVLSLPVESYD